MSVVWRQDEEPQHPEVGDEWWSPDGLRVWWDGQWVPITDERWEYIQARHTRREEGD